MCSPVKLRLMSISERATEIVKYRSLRKQLILQFKTN